MSFNISDVTDAKIKINKYCTTISVQQVHNYLKLLRKILQDDTKIFHKIMLFCFSHSGSSQYHK